MAPPGDPADREPDYRYERRDDDVPSEAVVDAVAASQNRSPLDLPPLAGSIDPDGLDLLCGGGRGERSAVTLSFEYSGRRVTVTPDEIRIWE